MSGVYQFELPLTAEVVEQVLQEGYTRRNDPRFETADQTKLDELPTAASLTASLGNKVDKVTGKGLSDENYTAAEKAKLAGLESSKYKGTYASLAALQVAHPTATAGSYADVDGGVGSEVVRYVWDTTDGEWFGLAGQSSILTGAQIKTMYEEQPDTNAFTDDEKSKLSTLDATSDMDKPVSTAQAAAISALQDYEAIKLVAKGTVSGAQSAVIASAAYIQLTCSAAVVLTFDLTGVKSGYAIAWTVEVTNGAEGLTFTNTIRWAGGSAPTLSAQTDLLRFIYNGTDIIADKIIGGA